MGTLFQNFGTDSAAPAGLVYTWAVVNAELYAVSGNKQNSLVNFHNVGMATVKLITHIAATGCFSTDSFNVNVGDASVYLPEVKYYSNELICTDNQADSYQWGYDDKETLDSSLLSGLGYNQQAYYLPVPAADFTNKSYWVITRHNGCYQKTYYNAPTLVNPVSGNEPEIRLFPNPADSRVNIVVTGIGNSEVSIKVVDMLGKDIEMSTLVNGKGSINVSNLPSGVYSVMFISDGAKIGARTFVKK
jgi:hypothetical protein